MTDAYSWGGGLAVPVDYDPWQEQQPVGYTDAPLKITVRPPNNEGPAYNEGWSRGLQSFFDSNRQDQPPLAALQGGAPGYAPPGQPAEWPSPSEVGAPLPLAAPGTAPAETPGTAVPALSGRYGSIISRYAAQYGVDPRLMSRIMQIESGGDPYNTTGSYRGLFQLGPDEWRRYGGRGNVFDPDANVRAAAAKIADEVAEFRETYGRDPTPTEIYLTHQQGAGGLARHMANPDAPAWMNMAATAEGRQKGEAWAKRAIWGNIPDDIKRVFGSVDRVTSADFASIWRSKVEGEGARYSPLERAVATDTPEERAAYRRRRENKTPERELPLLNSAANFMSTFLRANAEKPLHYGEALRAMMQSPQQVVEEANKATRGEQFDPRVTMGAAATVMGGTPIGAPKMLPGEVVLGAGPIKSPQVARLAPDVAAPAPAAAAPAETISGTALLDRKGNIYSGSTPGEAFDKAVQAGAKTNELTHVFTTSTGRIVNPDEARMLAGQSGQVPAGHPSEYLKPGDINGAGAQAAEAAAPGLQHGQPPAGGGGVRPGEGSRSGEAGLEQAQRASEAASAGARPIEGLPQDALPIKHADGTKEWFVPGPNKEVRDIADQYMEQRKLGPGPTVYADVDKPRAARIAQAYEEMPHAPNDPRVRASYNAMIDETVAQYKLLEGRGYKFEAIPPGAKDPYEASPRLANKDFNENKHLWYFPTDSGFGTSTAFDASNNPLLRPSGMKDSNGRPMLANDVFRVVHDVFGHFKEGNGFRAAGEENAWRSHSTMYSPLARGAMTSETRGQNSWLNYGPHGDKNRTAKSADTVFADQKTGLMPDWVMKEGAGDTTPINYDPFAMTEYPGTISARFPTGKNATEDPITNKLGVSSSEYNANQLQGNVAQVRAYPVMSAQEARLPVEQARDAFVKRVADNLLWLYDQVPEAIRGRSKLWYEGANKIVNRQAEKYGITPESTAGVYAALSPQKDWYQNVSLGDRVLDSYFNHAGDKITREHLSRLDPKNKLLEEKYREGVEKVLGKSLNELTDIEDKAMWVRLHDQTHREPFFHVITPEGEHLGHSMTEGTLKSPSRPAKIQWGSLDEIGKAIASIEAKGHADTISRTLGDAHKVRSFYNNMLHPHSPHDVTIDTHAVAAGLLQPLASKDMEVARNFGTYAGKGIPGAKSSEVSGMIGHYGLYADAYRLAAQMRGILPREMQSITWEAVRGLFTDVYKTETNKTAVKAMWDKYRRGEATLDETRNAISEHAGGINDPTWLGK